MIYQLAEPIFFLGSVLGFLLGCFLHVGAQRWVVTRFGGPSARWMLPPHGGARRYVDPFGSVAALLGGVGWGTPLEAASYRRTNRGRAIAMMLVGPLANVAAAVALVAAFAATNAVDPLSGSPTFGDLLHGRLGVASAGPTILFAAALVNLWMAVLSLVPLPPLEGGRILFLLAPRTLGWQKAEYQLEERNIGIVIVLIGLILSLGARPAPLAYLVDTIGWPILQALLQAFGAA